MMVDNDINTPSNENFLITKNLRSLCKIGEGSYAKVYLTEYTTEENKSNVACKIIDVSKAPLDFVNKFLPREIDILPKLIHPYVIRTLDIFQHHNRYFIVMPYAEKGDLLHYIIQYGKIAENQALEWFKQLLSALQYLHGMDIAHRDLKCENVLITKNNQVKLSDFGFSRYYNYSVEEDLSKTYCGSTSYAPPEIIKGIPYDPKVADIWSLGVVLFVMLNKSLPFKESNTKKLHELQMNKDWKLRSKIIGSVSSQCIDIMKGMLEPACNKRFTLDQLICSEWCTDDVHQ